MWMFSRFARQKIGGRIATFGGWFLSNQMQEKILESMADFGNSMADFGLHNSSKISLKMRFSLNKHPEVTKLKHNTPTLV